MNPRAFHSLAALLFAFGAGVPVAALAEEDPSCFRGSAESGSLTFTGAVEGTEFTGRFGEFRVAYCMPRGQPAAGTIEVRVRLVSVDTENRKRDRALVGQHFFAVDRYPEATWISSTIERRGDAFRADGELTLKGRTASQPIEFVVEPDGAELQVRGAFTLSGNAEVDRQRFGVGTGDFADPQFVRNRVDVAFEVRLRR